MTPPEQTPEKTNPDRRRRSRVRGATPGWIAQDTEAFSDPWEVRIEDVSRHGVAFASSEKLESGQNIRIRIGRGPIELSRRVRVIRCSPEDNGVFRIGGEFIDEDRSAA